MRRPASVRVYAHARRHARAHTHPRGREVNRRPGTSPQTGKAISLSSHGYCCYLRTCAAHITHRHTLLSFTQAVSEHMTLDSVHICVQQCAPSPAHATYTHLLRHSSPRQIRFRHNCTSDSNFHPHHPAVWPTRRRQHQLRQGHVSTVVRMLLSSTTNSALKTGTGWAELTMFSADASGRRQGERGEGRECRHGQTSFSLDDDLPGCSRTTKTFIFHR